MPPSWQAWQGEHPVAQWLCAALLQAYPIPGLSILQSRLPVTVSNKQRGRTAYVRANKFTMKFCHVPAQTAHRLCAGIWRRISAHLQLQYLGWAKLSRDLRAAY